MIVASGTRGGVPTHNAAASARYGLEGLRTVLSFFFCPPPRTLRGASSAAGRSLAVWSALLLGACGGGDSSTPVADTTVHQIRYEVGGSTDSVLLTYRAPDRAVNGQQVSVPWRYSTQAQAGDALLLSAQNDASLNTVTVTIWVDGRVFDSASNSGAWVVAAAGGTCC